MCPQCIIPEGRPQLHSTSTLPLPHHLQTSHQNKIHYGPSFALTYQEAETQLTPLTTAHTTTPPSNHTQAPTLQTNTPLSTPVHHIDLSNTQQSHTHNANTWTPHNRLYTLYTTQQNDPWGDCWAVNQSTQLFHMASQKMGTISLT